MKTPNLSLEDMQQQISATGQRVDVIHKELFQKLQPVLASLSLLILSQLPSSVQNDDTGKTSSQQSQQSATGSEKKACPSYAEATSSHLGVFGEAVKSVVVQTIREQKHEEMEKISVAIYGLPEVGNDAKNLNKALAEVDFKGKFVSFIRIGHIANKSVGNESAKANAAKPRPLKVVLLSWSARANLLDLFARKKQATKLSFIITAWLSREEMVNIKSLWQRCHELNDKSGDLTNARKPYFIISGRLRRREKDGKLFRLDGEVPAKDISNVHPTEPKNGQGGSRVAPSQQS